MTVDLEAADEDLLITAIRSLGYDVQRRDGGLDVLLNMKVHGRLARVAVIQDHKIQVAAGNDTLVNQIKQAYSRQIVATAAKRFGWVSKHTSENKMMLTRRS